MIRTVLSVITNKTLHVRFAGTRCLACVRTNSSRAWLTGAPRPFIESILSCSCHLALLVWTADMRMHYNELLSSHLYTVSYSMRVRATVRAEFCLNYYYSKKYCRGDLFLSISMFAMSRQATYELVNIQQSAAALFTCYFPSTLLLAGASPLSMNRNLP
jgi:hypothetical protein